MSATDSDSPRDSTANAVGSDDLVRPLRPAWMSGDESNDWPDDFSHENGNYFQKCVLCESDFIGHKRRHVCRKCYLDGKARYEAMTPEERAKADAFTNGQIAEFYRTNDNCPSTGATGKDHE